MHRSVDKQYSPEFRAAGTDRQIGSWGINGILEHAVASRPVQDTVSHRDEPVFRLLNPFSLQQQFFVRLKMARRPGSQK